MSNSSVKLKHIKQEQAYQKDSLSKAEDIVLENSLQFFFFEELEKLNKKLSSPLSQSTIYYSSLVLDEYGLSNKYFDVVDGRKREKTLGLKLMQAKTLTNNQKKQQLKDIAETSLMLCGYFPDSINQKLNHYSYYSDIGKSAYIQLNNLYPSFFDEENFFKFLASSFSQLTNLISILANKYFNDIKDNAYTLFQCK